MSIFDGVSRPIRAAGLGLLVVAVIAAAVGGISLVSGDDTPATTASSSRSPSPGEASGAGAPSEPGQDRPDSTSQNAPDEPTSDAPEPGGPGDSDADGGVQNPDAGNTDGGDEPVSFGDVAVRVYNNSDIQGLAADATGEMKAQGWNVVETGNYARSIIPASTVYFRPGTGEEAAARTLAQQFGMRLQPRFDGIAGAGSGIVVIVARDYNNAADSK